MQKSSVIREKLNTGKLLDSTIQTKFRDRKLTDQRDKNKNDVKSETGVGGGEERRNGTNSDDDGADCDGGE